MAQTAKSVTVSVKVNGMDAVTALELLERMDVVTLDPARAAECCGMERRPDGRCFHRPGHPIYVGMLPE